MAHDTKTQERFWNLVDFSRGPSGCWLWTGTRKGGRTGNKYGSFRLGKRMVRAHRFVLEVKLGVLLPPEVKGRHSCDEPLCCNPRHLTAGTQQQNVDDMIARGRASWQTKRAA